MIQRRSLTWRAARWIIWTMAKLAIAAVVVCLVAQLVSGEDTGLDWLLQIGERVLFHLLSLTAG